MFHFYASSVSNRPFSSYLWPHEESEAIHEQSTGEENYGKKTSLHFEKLCT